VRANPSTSPTQRRSLRRKIGVHRFRIDNRGALAEGRKNLVPYAASL
jgi:hypothetical protein